MLKKILHWLDAELELAIASLFLVGMVILGFIQIFCRYLPITPFVWTEELIRYLFMGLVFIPIGLTMKQGQHIRITFLKSVIPEKGKLLLDLFSDFCCVLFAVLCVKTSFELVVAMMKTGQAAATMPNFPIWLLYFIMPICFVGIIVRGIQSIIHLMKELLKKEGDASCL